MNTTIQALKRDHSFFLQLLDQLDRLSARQAQVNDWMPIARTVNTLCQYPELSHNRVQNALLKSAITQHWIPSLISDLMKREQARLRARGIRAAWALSSVNSTSNLTVIQQAYNAVNAFTLAYRAHLKFKESIVFPMLEISVEESLADS